MSNAFYVGDPAESELSVFCRHVAAVMPAVLIGYSALIDPLINFGLNPGFHYGGIEVADEQKSTFLTKLVMPAFMGLALLLTAVVRPVMPRRVWAIVVPGALLLMLAFVSALWAKVPANTVSLAAYQAILFSSLLLFVTVAENPQRVLKYLLLMFAGVVIANLAAVLLRPPSPLGHQGIYSYKNTLGAAAGCALIFGLYSLGDKRRIWRAVAGLTTAGAIVLMVVSSSKTAIALAIVAPVLACVLYATSKILNLGMFATAVLLAAFGISAFLFAGGLFGLDLDDVLLAVYDDTTFTGRTDIWSFVRGHIHEAPIFGHGYRGFWSIGAASPKHASEIEFIRTIGSSHNGFLEITLDLGLAGLGLLLAFILAGLHLIQKFELRPARLSLLYLSVFLFVIGRNTMESVVLWSTFFDNLSFLLVAFLAAYRQPEAMNRIAPSGPRYAASMRIAA